MGEADISRLGLPAFTASKVALTTNSGAVDYRQPLSNAPDSSRLLCSGRVSPDRAAAAARVGQAGQVPGRGHHRQEPAALWPAAERHCVSSPTALHSPYTRGSFLRVFSGWWSRAAVTGGCAWVAFGWNSCDASGLTPGSLKPHGRTPSFFFCRPPSSR